MAGAPWRRSFDTPKLIEIVLVALIYFLTARLGQLLAIPPGNVTPVWLPSGIILAWALLRGPWIWPGVFLGAFIGNAWAYLDLQSAHNALATIFAGSLNGLGDVLSTAVAAHLILLLTKGFDLFTKVPSVTWFIVIGALFGSLASAVLGVSGLTLAGFLDPDAYFIVLATWWTGDAVGVMVLGPICVAIISVTKSKKLEWRLDRETLANFFLISMMGSLVLLTMEDNLVRYFGMFSISTILIWSAVRLPSFYTSLLIFYFASATLVSTVFGLGPFADRQPNEALIINQLIVGTVATVCLYLSAARGEARAYLARLEEANRDLEQRVEERTRELDEALRVAETLATTDALTGIANRRRFFEIGEYELERVKRYENTSSLLMLDIDHFKVVNDSYGHAFGDKVLKDLTHCVESNIRKVDSLARVGGEEFAILLPNTTKTAAAKLAEKLRLAIASQTVGENDVRYTVSIGVSELDPDDDGVSNALARADQALYRAKQNGRNRVEEC